MPTLSETARTIFEQALADCNIDLATARKFFVRNGALQLEEEAIPLVGLRRLRIIAVGKAGSTMLAAVLNQLPALTECDVAGVVIAPKPPSQLPSNFEYFAGGHPMPNAASFAGARAALAMLQAVAKDADRVRTLCLFLISGGASAMMELPLDASITLEETALFHRALVASGAPIAEMNCVRKHFSAVKGGRLALAAGTAEYRSLLISDVPEARLDALGSGPTVPDSSTIEECREILARYGLPAQFPASVRRFFESPELPETPKAAELVSKAHILLDANDLAQGAARRAEALGWTAVIDNHCDEWEYRDGANYLLERLRGLRRENARVCLISAGEIIVGLPAGATGVGGRNQQFALYAATLLNAADGAVAILSAGSDGIDGNSAAAGAVVDATLMASQSGRDEVLLALDNFDAYPLLQKCGATIITGPSGNNLRDLRLLLA